MKKLFLLGAALAALLLPVAGNAADMPLKSFRAAAPVTLVNPCGVNGCTGFHVDAAIYNSGTGINAFDLSQFNSNGTAIALGGGWQYYDGSYWFGLRGDVGYDFMNGSFGVGNLVGHQMIELGGNLFKGLGVAPPANTGILSMLMSGIPTADFGACEHGPGVGLCSGATLHYFLGTALSNGTTPLELDVGYINANYGTTFVQPGQNMTTDNLFWFGGRYHIQ